MSIIWEIRNFLFDNRDEGYKSFQCSLMPTVLSEAVIGVRVPILRKYAKKLSVHPKISDFLDDLPHKYYEENNLHGFIISLMTDRDEAILRLRDFLPHVDNWATCDSTVPVIFKRDRALAGDFALECIASEHEYTQRFGIKILMDNFLDKDFSPVHLEAVSLIKSDKYYVNMMIAWFFATALTKQYSYALPFIEKGVLDKWVHNKSITKACESLQVPKNVKEYLKTLKK